MVLGSILIFWAIPTLVVTHLINILDMSFIGVGPMFNSTSHQKLIPIKPTLVHITIQVSYGNGTRPHTIHPMWCVDGY